MRRMECGKHRGGRRKEEQHLVELHIPKVDVSGSTSQAGDSARRQQLQIPEKIRLSLRQETSQGLKRFDSPIRSSRNVLSALT